MIGQKNTNQQSKAPSTKARVEAEAQKVLSDLRRSEGQLEAALEAAEERGLVAVPEGGPQVGDFYCKAMEKNMKNT